MRTAEQLLDAYSGLSESEKSEFDRRFKELLLFRKMTKILLKIGNKLRAGGR